MAPLSGRLENQGTIVMDLERNTSAKLQIMVVDDTPASLHLLACILSDEGYAVRPARSGRVAVDSALVDPPDLILLDVAMPEEDGYQVCARLKADERTLSIPVIFVSARDETAAVVKGFAVGGVDYITKPFSASEVLARVKTHLALRQLQRQMEMQNIRLQQEICEREQVEEELRRHKAHLEDLVAESTAGLREINRELHFEIEERKRAEEALRQSEQRFRSLVETTSDWVWEVDRSGVYTYVSPKVRDFLGYEPDEVLSKTPFDFMEPREAKRVAAFFQRAAESREPFAGLQNTGLRKDGRKIRIETSGVPILDAHGALLGYRGIDRDITGLKRVEEELRRLVTAIEQAAEGIVVADADGTIRFVNPAFERMTGYPRTEIIGRSIYDFGGSEQEETGRPKARDALHRGSAWSGRSALRRNDGTPYEAEITISPVRNESGDTVNYVSLHRDITREARLERELRQAQKMEAIGTLAGGIAHDFNNILMAICGYTEMTLYRLGEGTPERRNLDQVLKASRRAADLVSQILAFSRQAEHERKPVNIVPLVKETLKLLRSSLPSTIEIRQDLAVAENGGVILADPTQIHQVLMNLCANAAHAMRTRGGVLTVKLADRMADADVAMRHPQLKPGAYVCMTVSDTGHGIDEAILERIFDPYFTTKEPGKGTGLGLAVVQGIVKSCGGAVSVDSRPGLGSTFRIFLPKIDGKVAVETLGAEPLPGGTERILFVDDEKSLADLGKDMLESLGYSVTTRTGSVDAWETFRTNPEAFDLLVTDMTMPIVTGMDLAGNVLSLRPDLPVILCTGFNETIDGERARQAGIREFVMKPYQLAILAGTVRRVLDG